MCEEMSEGRINTVRVGGYDSMLQLLWLIYALVSGTDGLIGSTFVYWFISLVLLTDWHHLVGFIVICVIFYWLLKFEK